MTQPGGSAAEPARPTESARYHDALATHTRLGQAVAVVGIVVGVVFVTAVVFFAGFFAAGNWGDSGDAGPYPGPTRPGGRPGTCPMMDGGPWIGPSVPPTPTQLP